MSEVSSARSADATAEGAEHRDLAQARDGDGAAFTRLVEPLRRQLHAHCYRMLGSTTTPTTPCKTRCCGPGVA